MADNIILSAGTADGATLATDDVGGIQYQVVKLAVGGDGVGTLLANANPLPVSDAGGSLTVDGTVAVSGTVAVTDNAGSLTVDNAGTFAVQASIAAAQTLATVTTVGTVTTVTAVTAISNALPAGNNNIGDVDIASIAAGTNNIGDVDVLTVPADPFGVNADAASATGSISAKLRFIAGTGIPITGTVTVGSHAVTNAGTFVTQENGSALTSLQLIDDTIIADDANFAVGTTKVSVGGFLADETATDSVDEGDVGASRMTLDRKLITTNYVHAAAGGATPYKNLDCDETEDDIKTSAGKLFWIHVINLAATKRYIKFYDLAAASVSVGTTVPVLTFPIPTMADTNGAGFTINFGDCGLQFTTAICVAATTGFADNDTGAPGTNEVILNAGFL